MEYAYARKIGVKTSVASQATWPKAFQSRSFHIQISPRQITTPVRVKTSGGLPKVVSAQKSPRPRTINSHVREIAREVLRRRAPANNITTRLMVNHAPARYNARVIMDGVLLC